MSRKLFYFVRHGESLLNATGIRQGAEGSLSESGFLQAAATGKRLSHHPIEIILASPYIRTQETAETINKQFTSPRAIEYVDLLHERRNPSSIIGKSVADPEVHRIIDMMDKSSHKDDFRISDEENFQDLKDRAKRLLDYLATRREKYILVVTHGIFLRMIVAYIEYGDILNATTYNTLSYFNESNNAAVTICEYRIGMFGGLFGPPKDKRWKLIAWDDYTRTEGPKTRPI